MGDSKKLGAFMGKERIMSRQPEEFSLDGLIRVLRSQGEDAFAKQYSLGMWSICSQAAYRLERMREALQIIAGERQCLDNLMSNGDVAREALRLAKHNPGK